MTDQPSDVWPAALPAFLSRAAATPFVWGVFDCCLWPAERVRAVRGVDPAAPWRGRYATRRQAMRLVAPYGGVDGILRHAFVAAGLVEIDPAAAVAGDVGTVRIIDETGRPGVVGAVRTGLGWAALALAGLTVRRAALAETVTAWRV